MSFEVQKQFKSPRSGCFPRDKQPIDISSRRCQFRVLVDLRSVYNLKSDPKVKHLIRLQCGMKSVDTDPKVIPV